MHRVRDEFELGLYKHFYVESGRAYHLYEYPGGWGPYDKGLKGVPEKVVKRVSALGGSRMFDNVRREDRQTSSGMGPK